MMEKRSFWALGDVFAHDWSSFFRKNQNFLIYGIIWCIISFGFELFQYTESIDDEVFQLPTSFRFWAIQGRFTYGYVLGWLFRSLSVPFFALFFSQLCMLAAYILAFVDKKEVLGLLHYIAMPLFLSAPILFYGYAFNILTPIIGFGFLLSIIAVLFFKQKKWWSILIGLLCGVLAIGCYQLFFTVIVLFLLFQLVKILEESSSFKQFVVEALWHGMFALGCFCCYTGVVKFILYCNKWQMDSYITNMVSFTAPTGVLIKNGCKIMKNIWGIYSGSPEVFSERISLLLPLTILLVLLLLWTTFKKSVMSQVWKKITFVSLLAAIALTPFLFFFLGIARLLISRRTTLAVALVLPFLFVKTWGVVHARVRFVLTILAFVCLLQFLYVNSKFSYICYLREKQDDHITQYILNHLLPESKKWPHEKIFIYFQGYLPIPTIPEQFVSGKPIDENTAVSIFNDGYNRIHYLLKKKLYSNIEIMPSNMFPLIEDELLKMPVYPVKGFAKFVNGIAVVKMGQTISDKVRPFSKYKCMINETKNVNNCHLVNPADPNVGKMIWQGSKKTLSAGEDIVIKFKNDTQFETIGIGGDPGFHFKKLPSKLPEKICLRIKYSSSNADLLQVYFYSITPSNTLLGGHVYLSGLAGEHDIAIVMPSNVLKYTYFRLDPGTLNSHIKFDNISIHEYHSFQKGK